MAFDVVSNTGEHSAPMRVANVAGDPGEGPQAPPRSGWIWLVGGLLAVTLLAGLGWFAWRRKK